jgi:hypothetical protein
MHSGLTRFVVVSKALGMMWIGKSGDSQAVVVYSCTVGTPTATERALACCRASLRSLNWLWFGSRCRDPMFDDASRAAVDKCGTGLVRLGIISPPTKDGIEENNLHYVSCQMSSWNMRIPPTLLDLFLEYTNDAVERVVSPHVHYHGY